MSQQRAGSGSGRSSGRKERGRHRGVPDTPRRHAVAPLFLFSSSPLSKRRHRKRQGRYGRANSARVKKEGSKKRQQQRCDKWEAGCFSVALYVIEVAVVDSFGVGGPVHNTPLGLSAMLGDPCQVGGWETQAGVVKKAVPQNPLGCRGKKINSSATRSIKKKA